jgi:hypothetical protein
MEFFDPKSEEVYNNLGYIEKKNLKKLKKL